MALPGGSRRCSTKGATSAPKSTAKANSGEGPAMPMNQAEQIMKAAMAMGMGAMIDPSTLSAKEREREDIPQSFSSHHDLPAKQQQPSSGFASKKRKRVVAGMEKEQEKKSKINSTTGCSMVEVTPVHRSAYSGSIEDGQDVEGQDTENEEHGNEEVLDGDDSNLKSEKLEQVKEDHATEDEEQDEEEPDWESISQHEPAMNDVPLFLAARERREAADERFAAALDNCHAALKQFIDDILKAAADIYNLEREKLDALEAGLKHDFVRNEEARATMQKNLEESATVAQGLFAQLLMRVSQPLMPGMSNNAVPPSQKASNSGVVKKA